MFTGKYHTHFQGAIRLIRFFSLYYTKKYCVYL